MPRTGTFYAIKAMERAAAGTAAADTPGVPAGRAGDREAASAARPQGSIFAGVRRVLRAVRLAG
jgi:hypothetical protein